MKKIIFFVLSIAAFMVSSCSSNDLAGASTTVSSSASASIAAYVADNYPDTKVITSVASGSTVTTTLNTGEALVFSSNGSIISYANNCSAGLAADSLIVADSTSTDSIGGHGHRGGHGRGHGNGHGPGGTLPDSAHVAGNGHGHPLHFENEVSIDSLSAIINTYINTNYSGYTLIHAEVDTICQGAVTEVLVCTTTTEPVKLVFDASGVFLFKAERIHYADVPTEVSAAVTANYSTYTSKKRAEKLTLADGSLQYEVFMSLTSTHITVTFNADGTVACDK
jgi:hypothetical protein